MEGRFDIMNKIRPFVQDRKPLIDLLPLKTPLTVIVETGNTCNFKCRFCYNSINTRKEDIFLPPDLFRKIISDLDSFDEKIDTFVVSGDVDPLRHPNFIDFIKIARACKKVKKLKMSTNASLLTTSMADDIISSGMDIIQISINGMDDEHYKYITNTDISFDEILSNVKYLHSIKKNAHIHIKCIGDFFSKEQQDKFYVVFSPFCDSINIERKANVWLDMDFDDSINGNRFGLEDVNTSEICSRPFYSMKIHFDGNVDFCPTSNTVSLSIGNVNVSSLYDMWNGKEIYDLRMSFLHGDYKHKYEKCSKCRFTEIQSSADLTPYRNLLTAKFENNMV